MQFFICDDEKEYISIFKRLIEEIKEETNLEIELFTFHTAKELLDVINERKEKSLRLPEIIFSDIEMSEMDGITLGKLIHKNFPKVRLVLLTAYKEFAIAGYETGAYRYLLKPVQKEEILKIILDIHVQKSKEQIFLVKKDGEDISLCLKDILYISAEDKYLVIHTQKQNYLDRKSLQEYEEYLSNFYFYRVHRKYLVNIRHHKSISGYKIMLSNGEVIPVSRQKKEDYYNTFLQLLERGSLN